MKVVGADIQNFEYTPKAEFEGPFIVFNEPDERAVLRRFFTHMQEVRVSVCLHMHPLDDFPAGC